MPSPRPHERVTLASVADTAAPEPDGGVRLSIDGGVAVITIDRPEVRNAIGFKTVDGLNAPSRRSKQPTRPSPSR
jgi:hypothetical protein